MNDTENDLNDLRLDPIYESSLRELKWILIAWLICCVWVIGYCGLNGYEVDANTKLDLVMGMPAWVFWGVVLPWLVATLFTIWFVLFKMQDHPLPIEPDVIRDVELESDDE